MNIAVRVTDVRPGTGGLRLSSLMGLILPGVLLLAGGAVAVEIRMKARTISPSDTTSAEFDRALRATPASALHGLALFASTPGSDERERLKALGVEVLESVQGNLYRVRIGKRADLSAFLASSLQPKLVALTPEDRVEPDLWRGAFDGYVTGQGAAGRRNYNYVLNADDTLGLTVRMHAGVSETNAAAVIDKHASSASKKSERTWLITIPRASLRLLAAEDIVEWIDARPMPFVAENAITRRAHGVDDVQEFDTVTGTVNGLGGAGVQVGLFDDGIDEEHKDFSVHRVFRNMAGAQLHGTHLAGVIAGNGEMGGKTDSRGDRNIGTRYSHRGMAPLAQLIDVNRDGEFGSSGASAELHLELIDKARMDLSNHAYKFSCDGKYDENNWLRDRLIRGDAFVGLKQVRARLHVTSAGNQGVQPDGCMRSGYFSLTKQVKNALVVGNWSFADVLVASSSRGPADDGRIKPDVVARGNAVQSTGYCPSTLQKNELKCIDTVGGTPVPIIRKDFYRQDTGTSQASAAVTGVLALVLEQYARTYGVPGAPLDLDAAAPLPSTLRALMIHTARDLRQVAAIAGNSPIPPPSGPDFKAGWGLINARAAVQTVKNKLLQQDGVLTQECERIVYTFNVTQGPVRVTLAWDDAPASTAAPEVVPKLVNDLDLVLIDPAQTRHYPWRLDQTIVDAKGAPIANDKECGTEIAVKRKFMPDTDPGPSPDETIGALPAERGPDHLNNVEVVDAPFSAGLWRAEITAFKLRDGPRQTFSLVGGTFTRLP